jgi:ATP-binding cassette subfamily B multidrug efflux pump
MQPMSTPKSTTVSISHPIANKMLREILFSRPWIRLAMILCSAASAAFGVLGPFFQKEFIDQLSGTPAVLSSSLLFLQQWIAHSTLLCLILAFACALLSLGCFQIVSFLGATEAIYIQRLWSQRMYDRILELRTDTLAGRPVGEIVSIYTTDLPGATILLEQSMPQAFSIIFPLTLAPFLIVTLFHAPIAPTLSIVFFIIALNLTLALRQSRFFYKFKKLAADRVGLVNEWIQNIRTLRILGWVREFENKIIRVREVETKNRVSMLNNGQTMNAIATSITFILNVTLISSLIFWHQGEITPGALLAILWIVAIFLTRSFRQMPWFFTFLFDGTSSLNRAATLFSIVNEEVMARDQHLHKLRGLEHKDPSIQMALNVDRLNLEIHRQSILKNISFSIRQGEFIAIVGEVGSGKTMLLLSLLAETGARFGHYEVLNNNAVALPANQLRQFFTFVPQEGFIMSATLRENVAFEYDVPNTVDNDVLESLKNAQFGLAQERIKEGLESEIGERGVNLSGGQKQRISLARVDYYDSPIVLLDDCLSALDVETERKLMDSLLFGTWKNKTRVLATHRLTVLDKTDRVFFLRDGELIAQGSYNELLKTHAEFRDYTSSLSPAPTTQDLSLATKAIIDSTISYPTGEE